MAIVLQTTCGVCPPCGATVAVCAVDQRQGTVSADGWSHFVSPTIVATVDATGMGGGAAVPAGLPAVGLTDWVRVDYRGPSGELIFFKFYRPVIALPGGASYVGTLAHWRSGPVSMPAGTRVRRRDYDSGAIGFYQASETVSLGLHDDPADDARFTPVGAGAGAYVYEFALNLWTAAVWGVSASSQRPLAFVQPTGTRPWSTGSETREHHRPSTPWWLALVRTCVTPSVYTSSIRKFLRWRDTTTITLETGEEMTSVREWTVSPAAQTIAVVITSETPSLAVPAVPSLPANLVNIQHQNLVLNIESWRYPEIPGRGTIDLALEHYGAAGAACGPFASGWSDHDWRNAGSPDGASNYALLDFALEETRVDVTWQGTAAWFKYDIDPKPDGAGGCVANPTPSQYQYALRCEVRQLVELLDEVDPVTLIPDAWTAAGVGSWIAAGATLSVDLIGLGAVASGWVDTLPCLNVIATQVQVRHTTAGRYFLIGECGAVGDCVSMPAVGSEVIVTLSRPTAPQAALVQCGSTCV